MKEPNYISPDLETVSLMQSAAVMENLSLTNYGVWNYGDQDPENQYYYYDGEDE